MGGVITLSLLLFNAAKLETTSAALSYEILILKVCFSTCDQRLYSRLKLIELVYRGEREALRLCVTIDLLLFDWSQWPVAMKLIGYLEFVVADHQQARRYSDNGAAPESPT